MPWFCRSENMLILSLLFFRRSRQVLAFRIPCPGLSGFRKRSGFRHLCEALLRSDLFWGKFSFCLLRSHLFNCLEKNDCSQSPSDYSDRSSAGLRNSELTSDPIGESEVVTLPWF